MLNKNEFLLNILRSFNPKIEPKEVNFLEALNSKDENFTNFYYHGKKILHMFLVFSFIFLISIISYNLSWITGNFFVFTLIIYVFFICFTLDANISLERERFQLKFLLPLFKKEFSDLYTLLNSTKFNEEEKKDFMYEIYQDVTKNKVSLEKLKSFINGKINIQLKKEQEIKMNQDKYIEEVCNTNLKD